MNVGAAPALAVVDALEEIERPRDGDVALVIAPSDHRDERRVAVERWVRVAGRWVLDEQ